jgi:hypothetical protein
MGFLPLIAGYLVLAWYMARHYYRQRHGVPLAHEDRGVIGAYLIGLAWPITVFLHQMQNPRPCADPEHRHARVMVLSTGAPVRESARVLDVRPRPAPAEAARPVADDPTKAIKGWLETLERKRPPLASRLTDDLLAEVGPPPLPPRYGRPSVERTHRFAQARTFGRIMAERRSRQAWLAYGDAERVNDPDAMERAHRAAQFWHYLSDWFDRL